MTTKSSRISRVGSGAFIASFAGVAALAAAAPAGAAEYETWTCRGPDGRPASVGISGAGWSYALFGSDGANGTAREDCGAGGAIRAASGVRVSRPAPTFADWLFKAPSGTSIARYSVDYSGYSRPFASGSSYFGDMSVNNSLAADPNYDERRQAAGLIPRHVMSAQGRNAPVVRVRSGCGPISGTSGICQPSSGGAAYFNIYRATFTLTDTDAPVVTGVSGDAVTNEAWAGTTGISVNASDVGGGVYRMLVEVDGTIRSRQNLAAAPCRSYPGRERTFLAPKPCPSSVGGQQLIASNALPEGVHRVRVLVEDAAGNQTTALGPVTRRIRHQDPGPNNGTPSVDRAAITANWVGSRSVTRRVTYGVRPTVRGRLVAADGRPVAGAQLRVIPTPDARGATAGAADEVRTESDGRFSYRVPRSASSRTLRFEYHQRLYDDVVVAQRELKLAVGAGVDLRLSRKVARKGQTVRLTGGLRGMPKPAKGKVLELQARDRGKKKWITFRTVRTSSKGTFRARYRFRQRGPARFQMRVRSRRSADYPFTTGYSRIRSIRVR